ncbi:MAG TPA: ABC transporter substrate-binding protein [Firmicutes bacterium]|nr:ABC transporter substrate-binding protein [Bacillota bacterium]
MARRWLVAAFVFTLVAALLGGALSGCTSPTAEVEEEGKTLVVGLRQSVLTLDPAMHRDRVTETVLRNIFDGLVTRTTDMEIVPEIAESYTQLSPTEWEFKIRQGITFHNGDPLTADDVEFTFMRIITEGAVDGQSSPRAGLLGPLEKVEKIDDYTVRFIFSEPWPVFLRMLPHQQIVPKKYIEEHGSAYFAEHPIGCGPFKFVKGSLEEEIVLERFDDYYGGSPELPPVGPAQVDTVIFKIIPETATRIAALQAGDVHIIQSVPPHLVPELEKDPNVVVKSCIGTRAYAMDLNTKLEPFDNVLVRQAMNYAVDMDEIIETILGGYAVRCPGPAIPGSFGYHEGLPGYEYNPEKAKELLAEAGYPDGFSLVIDTDEEMKDVTEAIAQQLQRVGIDATVRVWDWGVLKPLLDAGERKAVVSSWGNSTLEPYDLFEPKFVTRQGDVLGRGNYSHYSNPEFDELFARVSVTIDDEERASIYRQLQEILYEDCPQVFGYSTMELEACSVLVENWEPSPDSRINLHDVGLKDN